MNSQPLLTLVVTHYNEAWEDIQAFFKMLNLQRGIQPGACDVIIVQDGEDAGNADPERIAGECILPCRVLRIEHGGVSKARNAGLDAAAGAWVMFCDCDDSFYSVDSLNSILSSLQQAGDRADLIYAPFWMELAEDGTAWRRVLFDRNWIFIHAKVWRASWLREHEVRFDEAIAYGEDALFNTEAVLVADPSRIAHMKDPVYMWCHRANSCTEDPANFSRNMHDLYIARIHGVAACARRGNATITVLYAMRAIVDGFYELRGGRISMEDRQDLEQMLAEVLILPYYDRLPVTDPELEKIGHLAKNGAIHRKLYPGPPDPIDEQNDTALPWADLELFRKWIEEMRTKYSSLSNAP